MSSCKCSNPVDYRATSENAGEDFLYLRCADCGGKAGRIPIDIEELIETITDPTELDATNTDVAEKVVEHGRPTVSIHLDHDSPWMFSE